MRCAVDSFAHGAAVRGEAVDAHAAVSAPIMPGRMRSLAPGTLPGAAATARPDAIFPSKLRREFIGG